ncbi:MAG: FoF1 ATP synthase subunit gamma, partial [Candidatus Firestonebacteria bacterium]
GSYNSNLLRFTLRYLAEKKPESVDIITVGKKVKDYLTRRNVEIMDSETGIFQSFNYSLSSEFADKLVDNYLDSDYAEVNLLYNEFKNAAQTTIKVERLLPLSREGKKSHLDYIYEPGVKEMLEILLPKYLKVRVHKMLLEANASEQGLRMSSMDQANKNARDMIKDLTLVYNKARQSSITRELADLVGGAEAVV